MHENTLYRGTVVVLGLTAAIYASALLLPLAAGWEQQDFRTYYCAATAYRMGMDPYKFQSLQDASGGEPVGLPFVYPPHCLWLFRPWTALAYAPAYYLYLLAKCLALVGLALLWVRMVPAPRTEHWALLVSLSLGHHSTVLRDLKAGNVSLLEQLLVWSGIFLLLKHRSILGGASLLLSSVFKLMTAALAPLIVVIGRSWRSVVACLLLCLGGAIGYLALCAAQPDLWAEFIAATGDLDERGNRCPSSLSLLRDAAACAGMQDGIAFGIYAAVCLGILGAWLWAFRQTRRSKDVYPMLYLTLFAYVLAAPRVKDYSLILVLLPTLHTISALCPGRRWALGGGALLWAPLFEYQSLLLSLSCFLLLLHWIRKNRDTPDMRMALTLNPLHSFAGTPARNPPEAANAKGLLDHGCRR